MIVLEILMRHPMYRAAALVLGLALAWSPASRAEDWPDFRGIDRDGRSAETGLLDTWPEDGPEELWRVRLGEGYSAPVVGDGRVYTQFDAEEGHVLVAYGAEEPRELWRLRLGEAYGSSMGNGPRSTPVMDGDKVYALTPQGTLHAVKASTGQSLWNIDLASTYNAKSPRWGVSTSPLVTGGLLLLDVGGAEGASRVALDKETGEKAWTSGDDGAGYAAPIVIEALGRSMAIFFTATRVSAVDPATGTELWSRPWKTDYRVNAATPIFVPPDRLFIASGYSTGGGLYRIVETEGGYGLEELWFNPKMRNQFSSSVIVDDHVYGFDNRTLKCLAVETGEECWAERGLGHGSLIYADGKLFILSERGRLVLAEATPEEFRERGSAQVFDGKTWTGPTLSGGRLFLRDERFLVSLDVAEGDAGEAESENAAAETDSRR